MTDLLPAAADPGTTVRRWPCARRRPGSTGRGPLRVDWSGDVDHRRPSARLRAAGRADPRLRRRCRGHRPRRRRRTSSTWSRPAARCAAARCGTCGSGWPRTRAGRRGASRRRSRPACSRRRTGGPSAVTLPDDPGAREQSPVSAAAHGVRAAGRPGRARLHVTSLGVHEVRLNGVRVGDHLLDPGWTVVPAAAAGHHPRRHRPARRRRQRARRPARRRLVPRPARLGPARTTAAGTAGRSACSPSSRSSCRTASTITVVTDETWRASTGEIRSADLYDGCTVDLRHRQAGLGPAGLRRPLLGAGRGRPRSTWPSSSRRWHRPSGWSQTLPARALRRGRRRLVAARRRPERGRCRPARRPRPGRGHRRPSGTPRCSSRTAACTPARCARPRPPTPTSSPATDETVPGAVVHVPRLPVRRGRQRRGAGRRRGAGDQQRHPAARDVQLLRRRRSPGSTRTSAGRSGTTSSPSRPTARSATSGSAGPATRRRSRRPRAPCSTPAPSGRAGWSTWRSTRPRTARVPSVVPEHPRRRTSSRSAAPAGPTPPRSCPGRSTSPTTTPRCWPRSCRA